ncbi:hypothetical protein LPJ72_004209 [Coemansia sp. Benny D160-2]|nr:hypothetical protein LPJ72_004209 [Coemansia sp. Benny D160-2]
MTHPQSLAAFTPEYPADSLEFFPFDENKKRLLIGTYKLIESTDGTASPKDAQRRIGRIHVCDVVEEDEGLVVSIVERQRIETSAIFDIKWSYNRVSGKELVGVACASGEISVYQANNGNSSSNSDGVDGMGGAGVLSHLCTAQDAGDLENTTMCCSLDWSNRLVAENTPQIATSQSDGTVRILGFAESRVETLQRWQAHDLEAWITGFDYWNTSVVYSGGDDARLKAWDMRMDPALPILNSRHHSAGVCSIQSNFHRQHLLATGGYDETVCVWDTRSMRRPLAEHSVGGGVWRLKWHPQDPSLLLVAAMYNGFHVLKVDAAIDSDQSVAATSIQQISSFMDHESIAYGADWCQTHDGGKSGWLVGSCSFYDRSVHLWRQG